MILPKDVIAKPHLKIRNTAILKLILQGNTQLEVSKRFNLTQQAIASIVYKNSHLLNWNKNVEKLYRINRLRRIVDKLPDTLAKHKDVLDVQQELRKEIEGEKAIFESEKTVVNVYLPNRELIANNTNSNRLETSQRSPRNLPSK